LRGFAPRRDGLSIVGRRPSRFFRLNSAAMPKAIRFRRTMGVSPSCMIRALIVDDHALVREGMALLIQRLSADVEVMHAATLRGAIDELTKQPVDLVLVDYFLPDAVGDEPLTRIAEVAGDARIIVFSGDDDG